MFKPRNFRPLNAGLAGVNAFAARGEHVSHLRIVETWRFNLPEQIKSPNIGDFELNKCKLARVNWMNDGKRGLDTNFIAMHVQQQICHLLEVRLVEFFCMRTKTQFLT